MKVMGDKMVQAFPVDGHTFVGTATGIKGNIVHAAVDGTLTFGFPEGDVVITVLAGQDLAVATRCTGITSDAEVWIS